MITLIEITYKMFLDFITNVLCMYVCAYWSMYFNITYTRINNKFAA